MGTIELEIHKPFVLWNTFTYLYVWLLAELVESFDNINVQESCLFGMKLGRLSVTKTDLKLMPDLYL